MPVLRPPVEGSGWRTGIPLRGGGVHRSLPRQEHPESPTPPQRGSAIGRGRNLHPPELATASEETRGSRRLARHRETKAKAPLGDHQHRGVRLVRARSVSRGGPQESRPGTVPGQRRGQKSGFEMTGPGGWITSMPWTAAVKVAGCSLRPESGSSGMPGAPRAD